MRCFISGISCMLINLLIAWPMRPTHLTRSRKRDIPSINLRGSSYQGSITRLSFKRRAADTASRRPHVPPRGEHRNQPASRGGASHRDIILSSAAARRPTSATAAMRHRRAHRVKPTSTRRAINADLASSSINVSRLRRNAATYNPRSRHRAEKPEQLAPRPPAHTTAVA